MRDSLPLRLFVRANGWLAALSAVLIFLMMITVVYDVVARVFFSSPAMWVTDINEYLMVYVTFIPAAWILLRGSHVKVELVVSRLGPRGRLIMDLASNFIGLVYCVILAWEGSLISWQAYVGGYRFSTALAAPQFPVYVIIPLGAAWLALAFVFNLLTAVRSPAAQDKA